MGVGRCASHLDLVELLAESQNFVFGHILDFRHLDVECLAEGRVSHLRVVYDRQLLLLCPRRERTLFPPPLITVGVHIGGCLEILSRVGKLLDKRVHRVVARLEQLLPLARAYARNLRRLRTHRSHERCVEVV
jgi:hypothetical protein